MLVQIVHRSQFLHRHQQIEQPERQHRVNEREVDDHIHPTLMPESLIQAFTKGFRGLKPFANKMNQQNFEVRPLQLRPAATVCAWAQGQPWEKALKIASEICVFTNDHFTIEELSIEEAE